MILTPARECQASGLLPAPASVAHPRSASLRSDSESCLQGANSTFVESLIKSKSIERSLFALYLGRSMFIGPTLTLGHLDEAHFTGEVKCEINKAQGKNTTDSSGCCRCAHHQPGPCELLSPDGNRRGVPDSLTTVAD